MKKYQMVTLSIIAGCGLGAAATEGLRAQAQPPAYVVALNQVTDRDHYLKEFASKMTPLITADGGQFIVRGGQAKEMIGTPPKSRVVVIRFDNMDKLMAWYKSEKVTDLYKVGQKYGTFNVFAVEGVAK